MLTGISGDVPSKRPSATAAGREILRYLLSHREAKDTIQGIKQWWLAEQAVEFSTGDVQSAVADLVAKELVVARTGADGRIHYRLNPSKASEAVEHLQTITTD